MNLREAVSRKKGERGGSEDPGVTLVEVTVNDVIRTLWHSKMNVVLRVTAVAQVPFKLLLL